MTLIYCLISLITGLCTYKLIQRPNITPTRASAAVSLGLIIILYLIKSYIQVDVYFLSSLIFGASFVGMCSYKVVTDLEVVLASLFFAALFIYLVPKLIGIGGALGFSAFVAVVASKTSISLFKKVAFK